MFRNYCIVLVTLQFFLYFTADNKSKKRRKQNLKQDFTAFCERRENQRIQISPQLTLATFQYLSASKYQSSMLLLDMINQ